MNLKAMKVLNIPQFSQQAIIKSCLKRPFLKHKDQPREQRLFRVLRFMLTMNLSVQQMIAAKLSVFLKRANIIFFSITVHSTDVK